MSNTSEKPSIFVTRRWPDAAEEALKQHFRPTFNEGDVPLTASQIADGFANHGEALQHAAVLSPATDGVRVEPTSAGDALAFFNFDAFGEPDPLALHAGLEVAASEEKWIGTHFFNHPKLCAGYDGYVL